MIRSLSCILPMIEELLEQPLPAGYSEVLKGKVLTLIGQMTSSCAKFDGSVLIAMISTKTGGGSAAGHDQAP